MLIDTHCHIQLSNYDEDRDDVVGQAQQNHTGMIIVGCDYDSSVSAIKLAEKIGNGAWASVGLQPVDSLEDFDYEKFLQLGTSSSKVVAVGETGMDWHFLSDDMNIEQEKKRQRELFAGNISLAKELSKPLIIHSRDVHSELIEVLNQSFGIWSDGEKERGVLHCFTGTLDDARQYISLGFLISFTGIITFAKQYDEIVREIPLEKILIETDSPFLTPVPLRGKRNAPHYVEYVAKRITEIRGLDFESVADQTTKNAQRLFELS